jgi:hypothetical protein
MVLEVSASYFFLCLPNKYKCDHSQVQENEIQTYSVIYLFTSGRDWDSLISSSQLHFYSVM